jgi:hypothetical protein
MPRKAYIRKPKTNLTIFGYITTDTLGSNNVIYGDNPAIQLELYSIAIKYFTDISVGVKVSLKINEDETAPIQTTINLKLKNKTTQDIFMGFCNDFIKLYGLEQKNLSLFYKEDTEIIYRFVKTYKKPPAEQKLRFIEDDD